jgi:hypothetical protein
LHHQAKPILVEANLGSADRLSPKDPFASACTVLDTMWIGVRFACVARRDRDGPKTELHSMVAKDRGPENLSASAFSGTGRA